MQKTSVIPTLHLNLLKGYFFYGSLSLCFKLVYFHCCPHRIFEQIIINSVNDAEWPSSGKELPTLLAVRTLCYLSICNFSCIAFWF